MMANSNFEVSFCGLFLGKAKQRPGLKVKLRNTRRKIRKVSEQGVLDGKETDDSEEEDDMTVIFSFFFNLQSNEVNFDESIPHFTPLNIHVFPQRTPHFK